MTHSASGSMRVLSAIEIPELGPALGRIALPPESHLRPPDIDLVRFDLANTVFETEADARAWSAAGDRQAAVEALGRAAWLGAWEAAVRAAAQAIVEYMSAALTAAATASRMPRRKRPGITPVEHRAIIARLGAAGDSMTEALAELEEAGHRLPEVGSYDRQAADRWGAALVGVARKLEAAWLELEESARRELARWHAITEQVRAWRRPTWPLWVLSALVLALALYLGLILGGYLPVPGFLQGFVDWWWGIWDRYVEPA